MALLVFGTVTFNTRVGKRSVELGPRVLAGRQRARLNLNGIKPFFRIYWYNAKRWVHVRGRDVENCRGTLHTGHPGGGLDRHERERF